jgi:hypothetical protein
MTGTTNLHENNEQDSLCGKKTPNHQTHEEEHEKKANAARLDLRRRRILRSSDRGSFLSRDNSKSIFGFRKFDGTDLLHDKEASDTHVAVTPIKYGELF